MSEHQGFCQLYFNAAGGQGGAGDHNTLSRKECESRFWFFKEDTAGCLPF
jgi:hypothetical protein